MLSDEASTWLSVREDCIDLGGDLVSIGSKSEDEFVQGNRNYISTHKGTRPSSWSSIQTATPPPFQSARHGGGFTLPLFISERQVHVCYL